SACLRLGDRHATVGGLSTSDVHDPQPLPLIRHYRKKTPWIGRCRIDFTRPDAQLWAYLALLIDRYDAVALSLPALAKWQAAQSMWPRTTFGWRCFCLGSWRSSPKHCRR